MKNFITLEILAILFLSFWTSNGFSDGEEKYIPCRQDTIKQQQRSKELQEIVFADQQDRKDAPNIPPEQWNGINLRDRIRRERVGEIFGDGCFSTPQDYAAAALVYQHGDMPDHFYQTFIWSKRGVELGDSSQKRIMALGIDRYLVNMEESSFLEVRLLDLLINAGALIPLKQHFQIPNVKTMEIRL